MKRLISLISITVLLTITLIPVWSQSYCVYADSEPEYATDEEKQDAAICAYFNYRGGYFVQSQGGVSAAVGVINSYINQFFNSDANTTSIKSRSDFVSHIDIIIEDGHYAIKLDNTGVVFLDHLCKWLLGKDEFPNLYSGGSWGDSDITTDLCYDGFVYSGTLFYVVETQDNIYHRNYLYPQDSVKLGQPVAGITSELLRNIYFTTNSNNEEFWSDKSNSSLENTPTSINYTVNYFSDVSIQITMNRLYRSDATPYAPSLGLTSPAYSGYSNNYNSNLFASSYTGSAIYKSSSSHLMVGNPAYICKKYGGINTFYCGWVGIDFTTNKVGLCGFQEINRNDKPQIQDASVNFNTDDFNKNDQGDELNSDSPDQTFTPKYSNNNTSNYYTTNNFDERSFVNNYIYDYTTNKTIINKVIDDDSNNDPDPTPLPIPSNDSGSITPDGNGGYTFNLPDVGIPDFNGFNWSINGLAEKFPFSIPFDLLAFFTVLNAEPETPEIQATIPLGLWEWNIDWDLHGFDNLASLLRNLEFIGFCIALILITRRLIKG